MGDNDVRQILSRLGTIDERLTSLDSKVDALREENAERRGQCESHREKTEDHRKTLYENGLKSQVAGNCLKLKLLLGLTSALFLAVLSLLGGLVHHKLTAPAPSVTVAPTP